MKLDVKRQLFARSERVKGIDFHPTEPWVLATLYSGHVHIWSYETGSIVKTFELTDVPVRAGRFVARKNWLVAGSDDFQLRVYNYFTSEKITSFEAHPDYIRAIAVHPTQPFILTASDDMTIRCWDFENGFKLLRTFEGHAHYVMSIAINPKDTNTFASGCLDRTIKIWSLGSSTPNYTIEAHESKGVNSVEYYPHSDKPYILTTSDDKTVKIWDYTNKGLIATLEGHTSNVSFACYHPELPVIVSGSEDGTVKLWHSNTYRLEQSLNYGLERAWCAAYQKSKNTIGFGFDDGLVVVKMGREEPAVSMDSAGRIVAAKHNEIVSMQIKGVEKDLKDGDRLTLPSKELGATELYPQSLQHSPNGRFVAVSGDGEYIVYTALALRNQTFGSGLDFAWGSKDNDKDYAIRESATSVKVYRNFKERAAVNVGFQADGLSGGSLLGVRGQGGIGFFDWQSLSLVRRIEVEPRDVYWSESGELVALACDDTVYVLRFNREAYDGAVSAGEVEDDGVESAFEVVTDLSEACTSGSWVGDCFVYTNGANRLSYLVGDKTYTLAHHDQPMYILGYLPRDGRVYVTDRDLNVVSYQLSLSVVEYQTLVLRGDLELAQSMLPDIPEDQRAKLARFLEDQGFKEEALDIATEPEHRFELALGLGKLDVALAIAKERDEEHKWRAVGDAALAGWDAVLAEECFKSANDLGSLLLLYSASGNKDGLKALAERAKQASAFNVEFECLWLLGDVDRCVELLRETGRGSEAVMFAKTYKPSLVPGAFNAWKESLDKSGKGRVGRMLGIPPGVEGMEADEELFPEWEEYLRIEKEGPPEKTLVDAEDEQGGDDEDDVAADVDEDGQEDAALEDEADA